MKISEKLNLNKSQFELDFVDIDTDLPLFIDSNIIRKYDSEFNAKLTYKDGNGLIIPITEKDIVRCLKTGKDCTKEFEDILFEKSQNIIKG